MAKIEKSKLAIIIGHDGKSDLGAINEELNINEFELNKELADEIGKQCEDNSIPYIIVYRENGYTQLPYDINKLNPTEIICVHHNGFSNKSVNGTETLHWWKSEKSHKLAVEVHKKITQSNSYTDRGIKPINKNHRGWWVLNKTKAPCILIEPYFVTNNEAVLNRDAAKTAKAVIKGYLNYKGLAI